MGGTARTKLNAHMTRLRAVHALREYNRWSHPSVWRALDHDRLGQFRMQPGAAPFPPPSPLSENEGGGSSLGCHAPPPSPPASQQPNFALPHPPCLARSIQEKGDLPRFAFLSSRAVQSEVSATVNTRRQPGRRSSLLARWPPHASPFLGGEGNGGVHATASPERQPAHGPSGSTPSATTQTQWQ